MAVYNEYRSGHSPAKAYTPVHVATPTTESTRAGFGQPQLIFFCELNGPELLTHLQHGAIMVHLAAHRYGIALALRELDPPLVEAIRLLNRHSIPVIAWLLLPPDEGLWFSLQNYPQALERYRQFRAWAHAHDLQFQAIGLDIEPPSSELDRLQRRGVRHLARRFWLASENVLYEAARNAYCELISAIHHDGYEVHTYQLPILADDRRAGTTLAQRVLDIVDLPADVEVLICYSSAPLAALGDDLGGVLITSYGPAADGIGVGVVSSGSIRESSSEGLPPLTWEALERDLVLAAHYTDTIYVNSFEGCVERGLLPRIATINWEASPQVARWKQALVTMARAGLLASLLLARFSHTLIAWLGWALFALLLARQLRATMQRRLRP